MLFLTSLVMKEQEIFWRNNMNPSEINESLARTIIGKRFVDNVITDVKEIDSWVHHLYRVSFSDRQPVVLRFPAKRKFSHYGESYNFRREVVVSDLLSKSTFVTVPRILHQGEHKSIEYLIVENLDDFNLNTITGGDIKSAPTQIIKDWGILMASVHRIKSGNFGSIENYRDVNFERWSDFVRDYLRLKSDLDFERDPRLVLYNTHGDNMIVRNGKMIGFSDVMLAFFGDRSIDFMFPRFFGVEEQFKEGYLEAGGSIPTKIDSLTTIALMNYYLSTVINYVGAEGRRASWSDSYRAKLELLLKENDAI